MIDFRYHLVSLIAVFLALGIGIVVGATAIDRAVVGRQDGELERLETVAASATVQRDEALAEISADDEFFDKGARFIVEKRLSGQNVTVVTAAGVDPARAEEMVQVLRLGGATVPAVIELTQKFALSEQTSRDQLALFVGAPQDADVATIRKYATANLAVKLGNAKLPPDDEGLVAADVQANLLGRLADDGFITVIGQDTQQGLDPNTLGGPGTLAVVVGGSDMSAGLLNDVFLPLTLQMGSGGRTLAVAAASDNPVFMTTIRSDAEVTATMSSVDNIDTRVGRLVAVIALQQELNGVYEQLGTGPLSQSLLPQRAS